MAADLKLYRDLGCSIEVDNPGAFYDLQLGPVTGLDGDSGDRSDITLYLKNVGDKPAESVRIYKENDPLNRISIGDGTHYFENNVDLGDIIEGYTKPFLIKTVIAARTLRENFQPKLYFSYSSEA